MYMCVHWISLHICVHAVYMCTNVCMYKCTCLNTCTKMYLKIGVCCTVHVIIAHSHYSLTFIPYCEHVDLTFTSYFFILFSPEETVMAIQAPAGTYLRAERTMVSVIRKYNVP